MRSRSHGPAVGEVVAERDRLNCCETQTSLEPGVVAVSRAGSRSAGACRRTARRASRGAREELQPAAGAAGEHEDEGADARHAASAVSSIAGSSAVRSSKTAAAPSASSSAAPNPPVSTATVGSPAACGRADVVDRVADHHALRPARRASRRPAWMTSGCRLGALDVGRGGPGIDQVARAEQVEVGASSSSSPRRRREDHRVPARLQQLEQGAGAGQRRDRVHQLARTGPTRRRAPRHRARRPTPRRRARGRACRRPSRSRGARARRGRRAVPREGAMPAQGVLVVAVDERAVDVEHHGGRRRARRTTPGANRLVRLGLLAPREPARERHRRPHEDRAVLAQVLAAGPLIVVVGDRAEPAEPAFRGRPRGSVAGEVRHTCFFARADRRVTAISRGCPSGSIPRSGGCARSSSTGPGSSTAGSRPPTPRSCCSTT